MCPGRCSTVISRHCILGSENPARLSATYSCTLRGRPRASVPCQGDLFRRGSLGPQSERNMRRADHRPEGDTVRGDAGQVPAGAGARGDLHSLGCRCGLADFVERGLVLRGDLQHRPRLGRRAGVHHARGSERRLLCIGGAHDFRDGSRTRKVHQSRDSEVTAKGISLDL